MQKKILFFNPFAGIIPHAILESSVARSLEKADYQIEYLTCGGMFFAQCIVYEAHGVGVGATKSKKRSLCQKCKKCADKLFTSRLTLEDLVQQPIESLLAEISKLICAVNRFNSYDFRYDGIEFGRIAAYQHLLNFKKSSPEITEQEWPVFRQEIINCLIVHFALKNYNLESPNKPYAVMIYNTYYGINATVKNFFQKNNVKVFSLHAGGNLFHSPDNLMICDGGTLTHLRQLMAIWPSYVNNALNKNDIDWVTDHFVELSKGRSPWVYSGAVNPIPKSARQYWKIPDNKKVVLIGMSSYDERFAAQYVGLLETSKDAIYGTQIEWIKDLIGFAKCRRDLFFILRIHPREFPNKREGQLSAHVSQIFGAAENLPNNFVINTPEDEISFYELASDVDVLLTAWSSVAKEMMALGMPVVLFTSDMQSYPTDNLRVGENPDDYFNKIDEAAKEEWSLKYIIFIYRWIAFESRKSAFMTGTHLSVSAPKWKRLFWRFVNKIDPTLFIAKRVGAIQEGEKLSRLLNNLNSIPESIDDANYTTMQDEEMRLIKINVKKVATAFWGRTENWPAKFCKMMDHCQI